MILLFPLKHNQPLLLNCNEDYGILGVTCNDTFCKGGGVGSTSG